MKQILNFSRLEFRVLGLAALVGAIVWLSPAGAQEAKSPAFAAFEYVTIRWGGRDNTCIIRPGGRVDFIGSTLYKETRRPDRADERSLYLNVAMNRLAQEGYELAAMTSDDIVMRKPMPTNAPK